MNGLKMASKKQELEFLQHVTTKGNSHHGDDYSPRHTRAVTAQEPQRAISY